MTTAEMMQALSERGYVVMDREEYDAIRAENAENEVLRARLDEAQLRSIEARNPGIDMDEVRHARRCKAVAYGSPHCTCV